ncbi:unnamed protein product [Protopolystoma xenopodis]|uniref:Uncharacterized protein n=1 Tax=Protopolystoma xenopodis TaxID=117903 RepID=A0A3S5BYM6_9PLAT|nr:unnamed protein product [Protopolystoma xenopodis]
MANFRIAKLVLWLVQTDDADLARRRDSRRRPLLLYIAHVMLKCGAGGWREIGHGDWTRKQKLATQVPKMTIYGSK